VRSGPFTPLQTTYGRATAYSEREREFTFAKKRSTVNEMTENA